MQTHSNVLGEQIHNRKDFFVNKYCADQWRRLAWASGALAPNIFSLAPDNSTSEEIMITVH